MKKVITITSCWNCPFFNRGKELECNHPQFEDSKIDDNMIIDSNLLSKGILPERCPLKITDTIITYTVKN